MAGMAPVSRALLLAAVAGLAVASLPVCWLDSSVRGVGTIPDSCNATQVRVPEVGEKRVNMLFVPRGPLPTGPGEVRPALLPHLQAWLLRCVGAEAPEGARGPVRGHFDVHLSRLGEPAWA